MDPTPPAPITPTLEDRRAGILVGTLIGDAIAMPVHWYYDRTALNRDYPNLQTYQSPRSFHPDSILWRSSYRALNERGNILHQHSKFWGQRGIHYHQFLKAGQNTLNLQLAHLLSASILHSGRYHLDDYLERYITFMLTEGSHNDTYVEEYHRHFFTRYAQGHPPRQCGGNDIHIGGLAHVGFLCAQLGDRHTARQAVREHIGFSHSPAVVSAAEALTQMIFDALDGKPVRQAILTHGQTWLSSRKTNAWSKEPDLTVVGTRLSPACYLPDAFTAALYLAWKYADQFEDALLANARVGGDNCHRGAVIGALLGAATGASHLPPHRIKPLRPPQNAIPLSNHS
jgi:ADP-ribosylglycohydrolase